MVPVFLALQAVAGVALSLQPQAHLREVVWPTHATVAAPQGWIKPADHLSILENGRRIAANIEIVARWPDGSPKWLHAYANFRYVGGQPAQYELDKRAEPAAPAPASPLAVNDEKGGITVDTGALKFVVSRPFAGITMARLGEQVVIDGAGGPSLIDERGIAWHTMHDEKADVVVEQQGPAQVTIRAEGWYETEEKRLPPFCRFVTRITAFANSSIIKFDHATIFADDMRTHALAELAFRVSVKDVQGFVSEGRQDIFGDKLTAVWFDQTSAGKLFTLLQRGDNELTDMHGELTEGRSAGWFTANSAGRAVTLLTKDFWQKCPKEVRIGGDGITYYAWPKHGALARPDDSATRLEGVYKFQCFHTGQLLDSRLPSDYFTALEIQTDTTECKAVYARAANMEGVAMHNQFALVFGSPGSGAAPDAFDAAAWQKFYVQNPIARASPAAMAASGALGPVAAAGTDFPEVEKAVHDGMIGYARSIERYGDYGWAIYGNTHSEELMNPQAAGVPGGRPSLHRIWNNNHYQHVSTSWRSFAMTGDRDMLDWARTCTDTYASIGQVRYDARRGHLDGKGQLQSGPGIRSHNPGAFWHCKAFVPWGCRDFGMDRNDDDSGTTGHWPDPTGLLLAWLIDADRWAKDGYELWLDHVKFPSTGTGRETDTTLVHAIEAYQYRPTAETLAAIRGMGAGLLSVPVVDRHSVTLWEPTWLSRYHEMFPNDAECAKYVVQTADAVGVHRGIWTLAISASAYRITKDEKYLRRHAGSLAHILRDVFYDSGEDKRWDMYGFAPGPDRDGHFMLQWPRFHAALRDAKIDALAAPDEPGQYFCGSTRFDNSAELKARGTRILVWKELPSMTIDVQATTLTGGDIHATRLEILSPTRRALTSVPRLEMSEFHPKLSWTTRPSGWQVAAEKHSISHPESGLYSVFVGSFQIGLFQPLTDQPECQVLKSERLPGSAEPAWWYAKLARGYLVPLANGPIELTFAAMGQRDGSYVALYDSQGKTALRRYLRAGETTSVTVNRPTDGRGPWLLDAFSDYSGYFRLSINCNVPDPLLFGRKLQDVQMIRRKLGR